MKLSNRKQLLSEADVELKRMRKLAGLTESKKTFLIEEFVEGPNVLIASVNGIFDTILNNIRRGVQGDGKPLPTTIDKQAALNVIGKHEKVIISKIKSNEISDFEGIIEYIKAKVVDDMRKLGFPE